MGTMPSPKNYEILSPAKRSTAAPAFRMVGREEDWFASEQASHRKRTSRSRVRFLGIFFLGAMAILAWQSYGHAARDIVAGVFPQLRWLAPAADADPTSVRIEQITHNVDRIASDIAASHEQITHSIDNLAAGQDHMTLEIIRLRALSQFAPSRREDLPPQAAPVPAHKASQRSSQAR
jgi:hypothetical protein